MNEYTKRLLKVAWQDAGGNRATLFEVWNAALKEHTAYQARRLLAHRSATIDTLDVTLATLMQSLASLGLTITASDWVVRDGYALNLSTGEAIKCEDGRPIKTN